MMMGRRLLLVAVPLAIFASTQARAGSDGSWDGVWVGALDHTAPLTLTIANGKVVAYAIEGAPVAVQYTMATPTTLSFGDQDHFSMKLTKTSETTAAAIARGRDDFGSGKFSRQ